MSLIELYCEAFTETLASKESAAGEGGASALIGAIGMVLCAMVGNATVGRRKYAKSETAADADVEEMLEKGKKLRDWLLELVEEDAKAFETLAQALTISEDDPRRARFMEYALTKVCTTPLEMMRCCGCALELLSELIVRERSVPVSDIGVGAACCKAALVGASMNIYINSASLMDRETAKSMENTADMLLGKYAPIADKISEEVMRRIRSGGITNATII